MTNVPHNVCSGGLNAVTITSGRGDCNPVVSRAHCHQRSWRLFAPAACCLLSVWFPNASFSALDQTTNAVPAPSQAVSAPAKPSTGKLDRLPYALNKETPTSLGDLRVIEKQFKKVAARVSAAVVSVRVGFASGSGVVISEDGVVLCAAHVCDTPGRKVEFIFPDGKTAKGKTLGTNHGADSGLMKITDEGKWPHVEVGDLDHARLGNWVLALGHPGGFDPKRPVVVRSGRIILLAPGVLQTDCTLISGDSGGPLFDMHGRVIGIHSRISTPTAANFHVPISNFQETWDRLASGENWGRSRPSPSAFVGARGVDHPDGCQLERVDDNSPASKAGLKVGDIVIKINDQEIKGIDSFLANLSKARPGDELTFQIKRADMEVSIQVTAEARGRRGRPAP